VAVGAAATGPATVKSAGPSAKTVVQNSRLSVAATNKRELFLRKFIISPLSNTHGHLFVAPQYGTPLSSWEHIAHTPSFCLGRVWDN
jgi:hypothetical protein